MIIDAGKPSAADDGNEPPAPVIEKEVVASAKTDASPPEFLRRIEALEKSGIEVWGTIARNVRRAISEGMNRFEVCDWCEFAGIKSTYGMIQCSIMFFRKIVLKKKEGFKTY